MGGNFSQAQVNRCAELAYTEYHWFTIVELKQFFVRVEMGFYTSHKNFTPAVLMEFLKEYADERMAERYDHFSQQKPSGNIHPESKPLTDKQMEILKSTIENIAKEMGEPVRQIEDEEEYQKIRRAYLTKQMQQKLKDNDESI